MRALLTMAAVDNLEMEQADVRTAFFDRHRSIPSTFARTPGFSTRSSPSLLSFTLTSSGIPFRLLFAIFVFVKMSLMNFLWVSRMGRVSL
jgi:hypothetical protein